MGHTQMDGWWHPDPDDRYDRPDWVPVDLVKSDLSELIEVGPNRSMRRHLHPGPMTAEYTDPARPAPIAEPGEPFTLVVTVPAGQCRYVQAPPGWELTIR
jgi:hypothetical protein